MNARPMNEQLRGLPRELLEDHVLDRIKHFAVVFAQELVPGITQQQLDLAFSRALYSISAQETNGVQAQLELKFNHNCRFMGCSNQDCQLCKNNPHKTCDSVENFDEAYADNQVLKARCEAEVYIELINQVTGDVYSAPGVEVQLSVIDGDAYSDTAPEPLATIVELHSSDEGVPLLQCYGTNRAIHVGTVVVSLQNGRAKLPDVFITDKNDTFHFNEGATTGHFRLLALAMRRDELGNPVPVEGVAPAVSNSFVVKTQRALNDYRKSAYPHYKDELTRLRYIGAITANRLKDARAWLGKDVPVECVDSVQTLKQLLEYADTNRHVETKLFELLNMRGRHKHKWDFLRSVLAEKVVYDDNAFRVWCAPDGNGYGLLYGTKQAQIQNMDKAAGICRHVTRPDGSAVVQVMMLSDVAHHAQLGEWRRAAEEDWKKPGHPGWQILQEEIEYVTSWPNAGVGPARTTSAMNTSPLPTPRATAAQQHAGALVSSASPHIPSLEQLDPSAVASPASYPLHQPQNPAPSGPSSTSGGGREYPAVSRQQLEMQHQLQQRQQATGAARYPSISNALNGIEGFGASGINGQARALRTQSDIPAAIPAAAANLAMRSQSDAGARAVAAANYTTAAAAAAAAHSRSEGMSTQPAPLRTVSDMSMATSSASQQQDSQQRQGSLASSGVPPAAEDAAGSAFMIQHPFDAVEVALMQRELRGDSGTSGNTQGGSDGGESGARQKRGRAAGEMHLVQDPHSNQVLVTSASRGRHQPMARTAGDTAGAGGRSNAISELVSLTPEDLEALRWTNSAEPGQQQTATVQQLTVGGLSGLPEEEEFVANGMPLTSTFSAALRIGDGNFDTLPSLSNLASRPLHKKDDSDSFKRILGDLAGASIDLAGIDALLNAPSALMAGELGAGGGAAGDCATATDQHKSRLSHSTF